MTSTEQNTDAVSRISNTQIKNKLTADFEVEVFSPESVSPPPVSTPTACDPGLWVPPSWTSTLTRRRSRKFLYTKHDVILIAHM